MSTIWEKTVGAIAEGAVPGPTQATPSGAEGPGPAACDFCGGSLPELVDFDHYVECPRCRTLYRVDWIE